jgi:hypothetical protein
VRKKCDELLPLFGVELEAEFRPLNRALCLGKSLGGVKPLGLWEPVAGVQSPTDRRAASPARLPAVLTF